jgi:hypothetical protein
MTICPVDEVNQASPYPNPENAGVSLLENDKIGKHGEHSIIYRYSDDTESRVTIECIELFGKVLMRVSAPQMNGQELGAFIENLTTFLDENNQSLSPICRGLKDNHNYNGNLAKLRSAFAWLSYSISQVSVKK